MSLTPQSVKSSVLRVAKMALRLRAIAAICASNCEMGRPSDLARRPRFQQSGLAQLESKANTRLRKSSSNMPLRAASNPFFFLPLVRISMP